MKATMIRVFDQCAIEVNGDFYMWGETMQKWFPLCAVDCWAIVFDAERKAGAAHEVTLHVLDGIK